MGKYGYEFRAGRWSPPLIETSLDAFDRAGLQLSDEQKQACIDLVVSYNVAGISVTIESLIAFMARPSLRPDSNVVAPSPHGCSVAVSAEGGT